MLQRTNKISIVISAYNASEYIEECINSILVQSFADFELIIVNDGSTDDTSSKIKSFKDNRIVLIENIHNFIGSLNLGIVAAKGKYIVRMDADDIMLPNRLEIQFEYMESHSDVHVCGGWMEVIGKFSGQVRQPLSNEDILSKMLLYNPFNNSTTILRTDPIKKILLRKGIEIWYEYDYIYAEDYRFWTILAELGCKFANIPCILTLYRTSEQQVTFLKQKEMNECSMKIQQEHVINILKNIVEIEPDFYDYLVDKVSLYNRRLLDFKQFLKIVHDIYTEVLIIGLS